MTQRFWEKVSKSSDGCWLWTGATNGKGYGRFGVGGKNKFAHRVAYEMSRGAIPLGMIVMHRCDTPACVNPNHLICGTVAENNSDMVAKGRASPPPVLKTNAKLTANQARQIRKSPLGNLLLASAFGVNPSTISKIKRGETWR